MENYGGTSSTRYRNDSGSSELVGFANRESGEQSVLLATSSFNSGRSTLFDISTTSASRKKIAEVPTENMSFVAQNDGLPRFAVSFDEANHEISYRFDETSSAWKRQADEQAGGSFQALRFSADNQVFFVKHSVKGEPAALLREVWGSGQRTELATDKTGDLAIQWTSKTKQPFAVYSQIGRPTNKYIDLSSDDAKIHKQISEQFPDEFVQFLNYSEDGKKSFSP